MDELRILAATGFGGIPADSLREGIRRQPHVIAVDMGTVDLGPYYLGAGVVAGATDEDLEMLLAAREELQVPLLCGSAGIAGGRPHLENVLDRVLRICRRHGWKPRIAVIDTEVDPSVVHRALADGKVHPLGPVPELSAQEITDAARIVGQIGPEPYMAALSEGADIVLGGRACDTSPFVAIPMSRGYDVGLSYHMAKIIECVSLCAVPGGRDCIVGTLRNDHFTIESMHPDRRCTPMSVAAHSLYEQPNPYRMVEPGGTLDTENCRYEAIDDRTTRVFGSTWIPAEQYTIKLEGVRWSGHRHFCIAGVRDAGVIANLNVIERSVRDGIVARFGPDGGRYRMLYRVYGRDGVLGPLEPVDEPAHEVCLLIDVVAEDARTAAMVCTQAKQNTMHCGFSGRLSTAGNLAFPFSPEIHDGGDVYAFNIYHVIEVADPLALSRVEFVS